jgi:hypothetical protein
MHSVRRFLADWIGAYRDGLRVAGGLPWLFGGIILWDLAQHVSAVMDVKWRQEF